MKKPSKVKGKIAKSERVIFNPNRKVIRDVVGPTNMPGTRNGLYAHFCYEWDEMLIDETDPEFKACLCGMSNPNT